MYTQNIKSFGPFDPIADSYILRENSADIIFQSITNFTMSPIYIFRFFSHSISHMFLQISTLINELFEFYSI